MHSEEKYMSYNSTYSNLKYKVTPTTSDNKEPHIYCINRIFLQQIP